MSRLHIPGEIHLMTPAEFRGQSHSWFGGKKVLLVMNSSQVERLALQDWLEALEIESQELERVDSVRSNPTVLDVWASLETGGIVVPDIVVAVGGGSSIDMAKALVALWYLRVQGSSSSQVLSSIRSREYFDYRQAIPILAVPTTAGTGSEVTRWATIWDSENRAKLSIEATWICPSVACIVPEFTITMPRRLTLSTGLDALCQAVEAYWARSSNPMVREVSKTSIRLIVEYLPKTLSDGRDLAAREKMCLGSLFSGLAFSQTRTTACHSISYPLTLQFGVEHGLACALTLPKVMEVNLSATQEPEELLRSLGVADSEGLQAWLDSVSNGILRLRLSTFGIGEKDIPLLVEGSHTLGRMHNNPVEIDGDGLGRILRSLL